MYDEFFVCECYSDEHTIHWLMIDNKDAPPEMYISVFLGSTPQSVYTPLWFPARLGRWVEMGINFLTRIWNATKYVFGYKSKYGYFDAFSLKVKDGDRMIEFIQKYQRLHDEYLRNRHYH